jgi:hypothetical protein
LRFRVRKQGEKLQQPRVSLYTRLYAPQIKVTPFVGAAGTTYQITASFQSQEPIKPLPGNLTLTPTETYFEDERGWRYFCRVGAASSNDETQQRYLIEWHLPPGTYPAKARRLVLHSRVGIGEERLVPLKIEVWNRPLAKSPKPQQIAPR